MNDITKNTQQEQTKKTAKTKEELIKQLDNIEKDITLKDKILVYLTSFKVQFYTFIFVIYGIPFLYTLLYMLFLTLNQGTLLNLLSEIFHINDYYGIINKLDSIYVNLINILQFGWLGNLLGIHVSDIVQYYAKLFEVKDLQDLGITIFFTEITYMIFTLTIFFIFAIIFKKPLEIRTKLSKLNEKLNEAYIKSNNVNVKETVIKNINDERQIMKNFEKDNEKLKKIKKEIIELLKSGKYDRNDAKETFQIAFDNYDSPFANQVAAIVNKSILKGIEELEKIENDEEFYAFIFDKFNKMQKDIILTYNFHLDNELSVIKKCNAGFEKEWLKIKEGKNLNKEYYIKILSIIYYFKNYPLSLAIKYLKYKKNIIIKTQEKKFIENFRWIVDYFLKKETRPDLPLLDLPMDLMFPKKIEGKQLEKIKEYYIKFLDKNLQTSIKLKGFNKPNTEDENIIKNFEQQFNIEVENYMFNIKEILKNMYRVILKKYDINVENEKFFDYTVKQSILEYFKFKETDRNYNENRIIINKLSVFSITDFYRILDKIVKKYIYRYNYNEIKIIPYYEEKFYDMNVYETFLYMKNDKEDIYCK